MLVDHSSIGADASGQGNDFHDENFAVDNTSQVWSKYLESIGTYKDTNTPDKAFNGDDGATICEAANTRYYFRTYIYSSLGNRSSGSRGT